MVNCNGTILFRGWWFSLSGSITICAAEEMTQYKVKRRQFNILLKSLSFLLFPNDYSVPFGLEGIL